MFQTFFQRYLVPLLFFDRITIFVTILEYWINTVVCRPELLKNKFNLCIRVVPHMLLSTSQNGDSNILTVLFLPYLPSEHLLLFFQRPILSSSPLPEPTHGQTSQFALCLRCLRTLFEVPPFSILCNFALLPFHTSTISNIPILRR